MPDEPTMTQEQAIDLASGEYGAETLRQIANYVTPIFWITPNGQSGPKIHNGTMFFVDAGSGTFAITAMHVFSAYRETKAAYLDLKSHVCRNFFGAPGRDIIPFDLEARLIDCDVESDIATFRVQPEEMAIIGSTILTTWPPRLPEIGFGIAFAGFPGHAHRIAGHRSIEFGIFSALSVATEINDRVISCQVEREYIVETPGFPRPPENFETAGLSGGPLLTHVERGGFHYWCLGGVIREASYEFEIIFASRVDRLPADGTIA